MQEMEITNCRSCSSNELVEIISLGEHYMSNFIDSEVEQGIKVPLDLVLCQKCKLLQLRHNAPENEMWGEQYWYKSGINKIIINDLRDIVDNSEKLANLNNGDLVIDIGCNDGTLLEFYDKEGIIDVGFEPSGNVAREAASKGFNIINNFFNAENFREKFPGKKAKIITAISMFYDLEDPNKFLQDIVDCLDENGLFVIQQNYLLSMLEKNVFDNICHEHREYYSLTSMKPLLEKYDLEIFDVVLNNINGGSIRTYIKFKNNNLMTPFKGARERIQEVERKEKEAELDTLKPYLEFAKRVDLTKETLLKFIESERIKGKTFGILGASTKGNTLLQYYKFNPQIIVAAAEANPDKYGKRTVGTLIPIVSIDEMKRINPDYQILTIWHLFEGIMEKEKEYLKDGGKFILPLPEFTIIEYSKEFDKLMFKKFM